MRDRGIYTLDLKLLDMKVILKPYRLEFNSPYACLFNIYL